MMEKDKIDRVLKIPSEQWEDFEPFPEGLETQSGVFIVKVKDFSNENVHSPGEKAELADVSVSGEVIVKVEDFSSENDYIPVENLDDLELDDIPVSSEEFFFELYANGITIGDKGYVSAVFLVGEPLLEMSYRYFEFSCVVSVIDASGNNRFLRSYLFPGLPDRIVELNSIGEFIRRYHSFRIDQLLERNILLRDPDDLLPGDCLTLHIEVVVRTRDAESDSSLISVQMLETISFQREESDGGNKYYLRLDSTLAKNLRKVSPYFHRMSETQMVERRTRRMNIPADEYPIFRDVCCLFEKIKVIEVESVHYICQMYMTADKYVIPGVVGTCRGLITTLLAAASKPIVAEHVLENIPTLLQLAEMYNDVELKENVETFLESYRDRDSRSLENARDSSGTEWKLEKINKESRLSIKFVKDPREEPGLEFYQ